MLNLKRENIAIFNNILINLYFVKTVGSVTKGWEGTGTGGGGGGATKSGTTGRKVQKFSQLDRLFSYSSVSAPQNEEDFKAPY